MLLTSSEGVLLFGRLVSAEPPDLPSPTALSSGLFGVLLVSI